MCVRACACAYREGRKRNYVSQKFRKGGREEKRRDGMSYEGVRALMLLLLLLLLLLIASSSPPSTVTAAYYDKNKNKNHNENSINSINSSSSSSRSRIGMEGAGNVKNKNKNHNENSINSINSSSSSSRSRIGMEGAGNVKKKKKKKQQQQQLLESEEEDHHEDDDEERVLFPSECFWDYSPPLEMFVDSLPFPPTFDIASRPHITLSAYRITQKLHRDLPPTTLYAFGTSRSTATYPGPTLLARRFIESRIRWENHILDEHHLLPQPNNSMVQWANPRRGGVPIVAHLHGGEVAPIHDGNPDAWFTSRNETGPAFVTQEYVYPNQQYPMMLWYHDHTFGITRLNNLAGLEGLYIVRPTEEEEREIGLPEGIQLVFKDWTFFPNGSIHIRGAMNFGTDHWCPEWFDAWAVNGKLWPYLNVRAASYRFRVLLASNAQWVGLYFHGPNGQNLTALQIGTDGGFLDQPMLIQNFLLFPSDRIDFILDFSEFQDGDEILLMNSPLPVDDRDEPFSQPFPNPTSTVFMKIVVVSEGGIQDGLIENPHYLHQLRAHMNAQNQQAPPPNYKDVDVVRTIILNGLYNQSDHNRDYAFALNNLTWGYPVQITPIDGSTEVWELINLSRVPHNIHVHLIQFQAFNHQRLDVDAYMNGTCSTKIPYPSNGTCFQDYPENVLPYQRGWKDDITSWDGYVLRILLRFTTREGKHFSFDPTGDPGYVLHCHILQHEDHIMMRPFKLLPNTHNMV